MKKLSENAKKVVLTKKDFDELKRTLRKNYLKPILLGDNGLVLHLFGSDNDKDSVFYINDETWDRNKLCSLADVEYVEIDNESKVTTISNGIMKTKIYKDFSFEEYFIKDNELIAYMQCRVCGKQVSAYDEEKAGIKLCQECMDYYDYNDVTDEFELIMA